MHSSCPLSPLGDDSLGVRWWSSGSTTLGRRGHRQRLPAARDRVCSRSSGVWRACGRDGAHVWICAPSDCTTFYLRPAAQSARFRRTAVERINCNRIDSFDHRSRRRTCDGEEGSCRLCRARFVPPPRVLLGLPKERLRSLQALHVRPTFPGRGRRGFRIAGIRARWLLVPVLGALALLLVVRLNVERTYVDRSLNPVDLTHASDRDYFPDSVPTLHCREGQSSR